VFRDISRRNEADKQQKIAVVEKRYDELRKARKDELKKRPEVQDTKHYMIGCAVPGILAFLTPLWWLLAFGPQKDSPPLAEATATHIQSLAYTALLLGILAQMSMAYAIGGELRSRVVEKVGPGPIGDLFAPLVRLFVGGVAFAIALSVSIVIGWAFGEGAKALLQVRNDDTELIFILAAVASIQMLGAALYLCFDYKRMVASAGLTAAESNAYQTSLENIEDHFRQKEELEQARATVAAAKAQPLSRGFVLQELGLGE
jgi:hypothetical protein